MRIANCSVVYIGGSFVTVKEKPGDFDACWSVEVSILIYLILFFLISGMDELRKRQNLAGSYFLLK
jgi:hypothetical protein